MPLAPIQITTSVKQTVALVVAVVLAGTAGALVYLQNQSDAAALPGESHNYTQEYAQVQGTFTNVQPGYNAGLVFTAQSGDVLTPDATVTASVPDVTISTVDEAYWNLASKIEITRYLGRKTTALAVATQNGTTPAAVTALPVDVRKYVEARVIHDNPNHQTPTTQTLVEKAVSLVTTDSIIAPGLGKLLNSEFASYSYSGNAGVTPAPTDPALQYTTPAEPTLSDASPNYTSALVSAPVKQELTAIRSYVLQHPGVGFGLTIPANLLLNQPGSKGVDFNMLDGFLMEKYSLLPTYTPLGRMSSLLERMMYLQTDNPTIRAGLRLAAGQVIQGHTFTPIAITLPTPPPSVSTGSLVTVPASISGTFSLTKSTGAQQFVFRNPAQDGTKPLSVVDGDQLNMHFLADFVDYRTTPKTPTTTRAVVDLSFARGDTSRHIQLNSLSALGVGDESSLVKATYTALADVDKASVFRVNSVTGRRFFNYKTDSPTPTATPTATPTSTPTATPTATPATVTVNVVDAPGVTYLPTALLARIGGVVTSITNGETFTPTATDHPTITSVTYSAGTASCSPFITASNTYVAGTHTKLTITITKLTAIPAFGCTGTAVFE